jgi:hypothetical protein
VGHHYHTAIDHILVTTITTVIAIHALRMAAGAAAKSSNPGIASIGKSVGAIFTFS